MDEKCILLRAISNVLPHKFKFFLRRHLATENCITTKKVKLMQHTKNVFKKNAIINAFFPTV